MLLPRVRRLKSEDANNLIRTRTHIFCPNPVSSQMPTRHENHACLKAPQSPIPAWAQDLLEIMFAHVIYIRRNILGCREPVWSLGSWGGAGLLYVPMTQLSLLWGNCLWPSSSKQIHVSRGRSYFFLICSEKRLFFDLFWSIASCILGLHSVFNLTGCVPFPLV